MEEACYILKEYLNYHNETIQKYGENSVVLMQVGGFYEIYAVINEIIHVGADLHTLADILGIQIARRNKNITEITYDNFLMAGFPEHALPKFQKILLNHNYTIALVNQVTEPPNPERKITDIISPGTVIENYNNADMNVLVSVYINVYPQQYDKKIYIVGLSAIDVSTGQNYVHRIQSSLTDESMWSDELFRLLHYYSPKETLFHCDEEFELLKDEICNQWIIDDKTLHIHLYKNPQFKKQSFQNEFLKQIFTDGGILTPIEYLGFERDPEITLSYIYMLQFIHEHKIENLHGLNKPIFKGDEKYLLLSHNCIYQLYLIANKEHSSEKYNSLMKILNKCDTAIGRRLCKQRLLYPILDSNKLKHRYEMISKFQSIYNEDEETEYIYDLLKPNLRKILDIEKLHRKMNLKLLTPYEFYTLHTSYIYLNRITDLLNQSLPEVISEYKETINELDNFKNEYTTIFDLNELEKYSLVNMTTSIFNKGIYPEIDELHENIITAKDKIKILSDKLSIYVDKKKQNVIKIEYNDKYGYHLYITENRAKNFKKAIQNLTNTLIKIDEINFSFDLKDIQFMKRGSNVHIEFPYFNLLSNNLISWQQKIKSYNNSKYLEVITNFHKHYHQLFDRLVQLVGFIDLNCTLAKLSIENIYTKPEIIESETSFFDAKDIRHPIVEKVQTEIEYIPNDISLSEKGILLFGTNACGKSTLMKSIGLTIIMAQAGFFVPCSEFKFSPYTQIFTRILNNDNIFKRQSSFAVEMSELRSILKRADHKSLVLGDELCSGTETISALSIVSAGLKTLSDIKCSFIFTSHLHQIMDIPLVKNIDSLEIYHLKIKYDKEKDLLIYERKLEKGSGPAIYGLEVCKAMDLGSEFISLARSVQIEITDLHQTLLNDKQSNYNADIMMDKCQVCSKPSEHTHHIKEQHEADQNGNIDHHHKNINHNLVPLCESCHHKVHNENLRIYGYHMTNNGIQLNYEYIELKQEINTKKKFNKKQIQIILGYQNDIQDKKIKKTHLMKKLELDHNIQISLGTLNKIMNNEY